jgi:hypothetical protein
MFRRLVSTTPKTIAEILGYSFWNFSTSAARHQRGRHCYTHSYSFELTNSKTGMSPSALETKFIHGSLQSTNSETRAFAPAHDKGV